MNIPNIKENNTDLTLSKDKFVKLMEEYSHEIPVLINGKKTWIHFNEHIKNDMLIESDIGTKQL